MPAHHAAAFVRERRRGQGAQVRVELAIVARREGAAHGQDVRHAVDDAAGATQVIAIDGPGTGCLRRLEGARLVEHDQLRLPVAQLVAMRDEHRRVGDQHRVGGVGDGVIAMPQHEGAIVVIGELLFELPERTLRRRVEAFDGATGLGFDQAARRQGDEKFAGAGFGGV